MDGGFQGGGASASFAGVPQNGGVFSSSVSPVTDGSIYPCHEPDFSMPRPDPSLISRLSVAIRRTTLDSQGALAQIWVPFQDENGNVSLITKNQFYIVSGCGDELAEYRQASTKYSFAAKSSLQHRRREGIGMPGRVFSSELPEVTSNVQNFTHAEYPRLPDAQRSQILASVVLPVFWGDRMDRSCQLVLELIPSNPNESFAAMISLVNRSLHSVGLTSFGANNSEVVLVRNGSQCRAITLDELGQGDSVQNTTPSSAVDGISLPRHVGGMMGDLSLPMGQATCQITEEGTSAEDGDGGDAGPAKGADDKKTKDTKAAASVALHTVMQLGTDTLEALGLKGIVSKEGEEKTVTVGRRREDRPEVSLKTLQDHFVYSLKDAANRLGMCPTTLKRCCRQHGITRWPKRRLTSMGRSLTTLQEILHSAHAAEADTPALQKVAEALSNWGADGGADGTAAGGGVGTRGAGEGGAASESAAPVEPLQPSSSAAPSASSPPPAVGAGGEGGDRGPGGWQASGVMVSGGFPGGMDNGGFHHGGVASPAMSGASAGSLPPGVGGGSVAFSPNQILYGSGGFEEWEGEVHA